MASLFLNARRQQGVRPISHIASTPYAHSLQFLFIRLLIYPPTRIHLFQQSGKSATPGHNFGGIWGFVLSTHFQSTHCFHSLRTFPTISFYTSSHIPPYSHWNAFTQPCQSTRRDSTELIFIMPAILHPSTPWRTTGMPILSS